MDSPQLYGDYKGESTEQLIAAADKGYLIWTINWAFFQGLRAKADRLGGEQELTWEEVVPIVLKEIEVDVDNGGFAQYFFNCSQRPKQMAIDAMVAIGHPHGEQVVREAVRLAEEEGAYPQEEWLAFQEDGTFPDERYETLSDRCQDLDGELEGSGIDEALFEFIKLNRERVRLP